METLSLLPTIENSGERKPRYLEVLSGESLDEHLEDRFTQALNIAQDGKQEDAIALWDEVLAIRDDIHQVWYNKGVAQYELNQREDAISSWDRSLTLNPENSELLHLKAIILFDLERYEEALECINLALNISPNDEWLWYNKGFIQRKLNRFEEAVVSFDKSLEIAPNNYRAWSSKAIALLKLLKYSEAIYSLEQAIKYDHDPLNIGIWGYLTELLVWLGRFDKAIDKIDQALEINPQNHHVIYNKALYYAATGGNAEQILDCLQEAIELDPEQYRQLARNENAFVDLHDNDRFKELIGGELVTQDDLNMQAEILARIEHRRKTDPARHGLPDPTQIIREARDRPTTTNYLLDPVALDDRIRAEGQVLLQGISWDEFEQILEGLGDKRPYRLAYDNGTLEIIMPTTKHEYFIRVFSYLIQALAEYLDLDFISMGSTTWKRKDLLKGAEPDNCFYVQNEPAIRSIKPDIDLSKDPPPDLIFEVDHTSPSVKKLPIYAALGVPEVWIYRMGKKKEKLDVYRLQDGDYKKVETSVVFAGFPAGELPGFVNQNMELSWRELRQKFYAWLDQVFAQPVT
jgi:tetratricopeptide (TPR) repeat protein